MIDINEIRNKTNKAALDIEMNKVTSKIEIKAGEGKTEAVFERNFSKEVITSLKEAGFTIEEEDNLTTVKW